MNYWMICLVKRKGKRKGKEKCDEGTASKQIAAAVVVVVVVVMMNDGGSYLHRTYCIRM